MGYSIWIEFEHYYPPALTDEDGFCNVAVTHDDGRHEGYEVCTTEYFKERILEIFREVEESGFSIPPDIIVSKLDREHITEALRQIIPDVPET